MVMEAVTDKDGGFHFPWWGPSFASGRLRAAECPSLLFYKNGYRNAFRGNEGLGTLAYRTPPMVHYLDHQDKPSKIEKLTGGVEEEFVEFRKLNDRLKNIVTSESPCEWRSIPRTIKHLIDLRKYFVANGKNKFEFNSLDRHLLGNERYFRDHGCGSGENFYESLIK